MGMWPPNALSLPWRKMDLQSQSMDIMDIADNGSSATWRRRRHLPNWWDAERDGVHRNWRQVLT